MRPSAVADRPDGGAALSPPRRFSGLARHLTVILAIKAVALLAIWWLWFSAPQARRMQMPPERVQQRLIEAPAVPAARSAQSSPPGNQDHATH